MDIIDLKKIINTYLKLRKDKKKNKEAVEALEVSLKNLLNTNLEVFNSSLNMEDLILLIDTYDKLKSKDLKLKLLDIILNNKKEDLRLPYNPEPIIYPRPYYEPSRTGEPFPCTFPIICSSFYKIDQENKNGKN